MTPSKHRFQTLILTLSVILFASLPSFFLSILGILFRTQGIKAVQRGIAVKGEICERCLSEERKINNF